VLEATINGPSGSAPGVRLTLGLTAAKEVTTSRAVPPPIFTPYGVARGDIRTDPRTTMRYDRARGSLDRHATYIVAAYVAGAAR
jgi:hypothetical protein